jgi:hypothetical protein
MTPAHLDLLRKRQRKACTAVIKAEQAKRGGISEARQRFVQATAELLRATLKASRQSTPIRREPAPDLFAQLGA